MSREPWWQVFCGCCWAMFVGLAAVGIGVPLLWIMDLIRDARQNRSSRGTPTDDQQATTGLSAQGDLTGEVDCRFPQDLTNQPNAGRLWPFLTLLFLLGCESGGGPGSWYSGAPHVEGLVETWIITGKECLSISGGFDFSRDHVQVELRPAVGRTGGVWWGVDEWGREVGGYLQQLESSHYRGVIYCDPSTSPLSPDWSVGMHEFGGHLNLMIIGIWDHPPQFSRCFSYWTGMGVQQQQSFVGPFAIYDHAGNLLYMER